MLRIENLTKSYKYGIKAVDDLTLRVEPGDIYGFIGHNGAGKTTTLRAVTGILEYEEGSVFIDGISLKDKPVECKRLFAFVPDNPELYDHLTGIQYLNFIADLYDISKEDREKGIDRFTKQFEIESALGDSIASYSHGMKQKLALTAALIHKPKLLILDEPFVGLDPKATHIVKEIMAEICKEGGAVFFSTHILEVAEKLCNKVAIIKKGKLVIDGPTASVTRDKSLEDVFLQLTDDTKTFSMGE